MFVWQLKGINPIYAIEAIRKFIGGYKEPVRFTKLFLKNHAFELSAYAPASVWRWQHE